MSQSRQPKGVPIGGQYAANSHDEAGTALGSTSGDHVEHPYPSEYFYDGELLSPKDALDRWIEDSDIDWGDLIEGEDSESAREMVFANTRHDADPAQNIEAIRQSAAYNGFDEAKLDLPLPPVTDPPAFPVGFPFTNDLNEKIEWAMKNDAMLSVDTDSGIVEISGDEAYEEFDDLAPGESFVIVGARYIDPSQERNPYGASPEAIRDVNRVEDLITGDIDSPEARAIQIGWKPDLDDGIPLKPDYLNALATHRELRPGRREEVEALLSRHGITRGELEREIANEFGMYVPYDDNGVTRYTVEHPNRILNRISDDYLEELGASTAHAKDWQ